MAAERSQNRSALKGGLIMLGIVAFCISIFFISDWRQRVRRHTELVVLTSNASWITPGSPVWIGGFEVGSVKGIQIRGAETDSAERVAIRVRVPRKYAVQVRRDSYARMTSRRLVSKPVIDLLPGSPSAPAIRDGDTLRMQPSGSIEGLMKRAIRVSINFDEMFKEVSKMKGPATHREDEIKRLNANFQNLSGELRDFMGTIEAGPLNDMSAIGDLLASLTHTSAQFSRALHIAAERARVARNDAEPSLRRLSARADSISNVIAGLNRQVAQTGGGLLLRAQRDSAIVKGLHRAKTQLDSLMAESKRNPLQFWF
jgi:ABC-type transporter Mla subunit MlaD